MASLPEGLSGLKRCTGTNRWLPNSVLNYVPGNSYLGSYKHIIINMFTLTEAKYAEVICSLIFLSNSLQLS